MTYALDPDNLPIDADLILAYTEDALTPEDRVRVRAALRPHPELSSAVEAMRTDRIAIAALPTEPAPDTIIQHIASHTDLPVLDPKLREITAEQASGLVHSIPVSKYQPARTPWLERWRKPIAFATAAAVLLVVGLSASVIIQNLRSNTPLGPDLTLPGPITGNTPADPRPNDPVATPTDPATPYVIMTLTGETDSPHRQPESIREALDLARAGHLAIRLRTQSGLAPLMASRTAKDSWRFHANLPADTLAAMRIDTTTAPGVIYAENNESGSSQDPTTPPRPTAPPVGVRAEINPTAPALASLLNALAAVGDVELIWLDQSADLPPTIDESDINWWAAPPSTWIRPIEIPIAVYNATP